MKNTSKSEFIDHSPQSTVHSQKSGARIRGLLSTVDCRLWTFPRVGFTLAELLIVVAILGILAAIALPRFFPATEKARVSEAIGILSAIRQGEEAYRLENGSYFTINNTTNPNPDANGNDVWGVLGINNPNAAGGNFTFIVVGDDAAGGAAAGTFLATATRTTANDPLNQYQTRTVTINQIGSFRDRQTLGGANGSGASTHPNAPNF